MGTNYKDIVRPHWPISLDHGENLKPLGLRLARLRNLEANINTIGIEAILTAPGVVYPAFACANASIANADKFMGLGLSVGVLDPRRKRFRKYSVGQHNYRGGRH